MLKDNELEFHEMFTCGIFVYLWKNHPLAGRTEIYFEELEEYPCLSFEQGNRIHSILPRKYSAPGNISGSSRRMIGPRS